MSKQKQFVYTTCSELVVFKYWTRNSMNNLLSYGLVDARISSSDKDLPVSMYSVSTLALSRLSPGIRKSINSWSNHNQK